MSREAKNGFSCFRYCALSIVDKKGPALVTPASGHDASVKGPTSIQRSSAKAGTQRRSERTEASCSKPGSACARMTKMGLGRSSADCGATRFAGMAVDCEVVGPVCLAALTNARQVGVADRGWLFSSIPITRPLSAACASTPFCAIALALCPLKDVPLMVIGISA